MLATRRNMIECAKRGLVGVAMFDPETGDMFSACAGDYWMLDMDELFKNDQGVIMELVTQTTIIDDISMETVIDDITINAGS